MTSLIGFPFMRYVSLGRIQEEIPSHLKRRTGLMFKRHFLMTFAVIPLCFFCAACTPTIANGQAAPVPCLALDNDIPAHHVIPSQGIPAQAGVALRLPGDCTNLLLMSKAPPRLSIQSSGRPCKNCSLVLFLQGMQSTIFQDKARLHPAEDQFLLPQS